MEFRRVGIILNRIFQKLKDHFWGRPETTQGAQDQMNAHRGLVVNIETEHMALFFHDIMRDNAIYKIMKSAQQTLEDDKSTLLEYRTFINVIEMYKKLYSYSKQCYRKALIKQKFEGKEKMKGDHYKGKGQARSCNNKDCKSCFPPAQVTTSTNTEEVPPVKSETVAAPITRANATTEEIVADEEEEGEDDLVEEEDEESSEDEFDERYQNPDLITQELEDYKSIMEDKLK